MSILIQIGIVLLLLEGVIGSIFVLVENITEHERVNKQNEYYRKHNIPMLVTME